MELNVSVLKTHYSNCNEGRTLFRNTAGQVFAKNDKSKTSQN